MTFKVQEKMCETCIYRPDSPLDLEKLEGQVRDNYGGFKGHRICHHSSDVCCAGFWAKHKNDFAMEELVDEIQSANRAEREAREMQNGISTKEAVRKRNCEMALVKLPGGIDVWNQECQGA